MGELGAFLKIHRVGFDKRDPGERVHDYKQYFALQPEEELQRQGARCMDCGIPFCHEGCPLGNLIPDWNDLVYRGKWRDAIDQLHMTNNFPEFTGRICPAPCESACVLAINDDAVAIEQIEMAIAERAFAEGWVVPEPPSRRTEKTVAVVGAGPAGLAAAAELLGFFRSQHLPVVHAHSGLALPETSKSIPAAPSAARAPAICVPAWPGRSRWRSWPKRSGSVRRTPRRSSRGTAPLSRLFPR